MKLVPSNLNTQRIIHVTVEKAIEYNSQVLFETIRTVENVYYIPQIRLNFNSQ